MKFSPSWNFSSMLKQYIYAPTLTQPFKGDKESRTLQHVWSSSKKALHKFLIFDEPQSLHSQSCWIMQTDDNCHHRVSATHVSSFILARSLRTTCKLCGTDLLRCSLLSFCVRTKLRHDLALKLHESSDVPVDDRAVPASLVVTISGMLVWSCNECLLIFMRLRYGIYSDFCFYCFHIYTYTFGAAVRVYAFFPSFYNFSTFMRLPCFWRDGSD